jgi:nucleoid-associated protein YgaU
VRATVDVTFKAYATPDFLRAERPLQSADRSTEWTVVEGDTLWHVAAVEYGDPTAWRTIAAANGVADPRTLEAGRTLVVPPLEE